ncbi:MAG: hypothetical protein AAFO63_07140, partial [Pseudomonadota bacterium]
MILWFGKKNKKEQMLADGEQMELPELSADELTQVAGMQDSVERGAPEFALTVEVSEKQPPEPPDANDQTAEFTTETTTDVPETKNVEPGDA